VTFDLRTKAVTQALTTKRIDEAGAKKIDVSVHRTARYALNSKAPDAAHMQAPVLKAYDELNIHEKLIHDRAYGEVRGFGDKDLGKWLKATEAAANAPAVQPAPAKVEEPKAEAPKVAAAAPAPKKGNFLMRLLSPFS
jgi:hypothetical protein